MQGGLSRHAENNHCGTLLAIIGSVCLALPQGATIQPCTASLNLFHPVAEQIPQ